MKIYRCGVIGLGNIGMLYELDKKIVSTYEFPSHSSCYSNHPRTHLVAGCDIDKEKTKLFKQKYPNSSDYLDYIKMLANEKLDIVSVCIHQDLQADIVRTAIDKGVKMIFCEKPFCNSAKTAKDLAELCKQKEVSLVVNYWRKYDEAHQEIYKIISTNKIGKIQHVHGKYGNGLMNNGSHLINLMQWYLGPVKWAIGFQGNIDKKEDLNFEAVLGFEKTIGTLATVSFNNYRLIELDLVGEAGRIVIKDEGEDINVYSLKSNEYISNAKQLSRKSKKILSKSGMVKYDALEFMVDCLDKNKNIIQYNAIETLDVIEAIKTSAAKNSEKILITHLIKANLEEKP